jgi:hypothetical protein
MEDFESLEPLVKIPTLPEMSPTGPSCGPEPEKKEQAPSIGLTLEPSQSSRWLDGGEQGGNSSKMIKTQSCSLNEQFGPDFWLKSSENR